jgi:uracil-DNA glycosylase family 4
MVPASRQRRLLHEPDPDCGFCPRLAAFRDSLRATQPEWHNAPVPVFGALDAHLLVVGLAPGLRGANRTGRPFTGDFAGDLLYETLIEYGFAAGAYGARCDDGLQLVSGAITNAVRCVPPQNKPAPAEIKNCRPFLAATIAAMPNLRAIVALGRIAHESIVRAFGLRLAVFPFAHGAERILAATLSAEAAVIRSHASARTQASARTIVLFDSYHCSRYNTNTGVLTQEMFRAVFGKVRERLGSL